MGELALNINYFYSLTYRQFINTLRGARKKEDTIAKERLILTRKLMFASLMPHLKRGATETSIWSFDWETEAVTISAQKTREELQADLEAVKKYWEEIDKKRGIVN